MGLPEDHPLKEGELISLDNLTEEVQLRLTRKKELDSIAQQAEGLRVVDGIKGEEVKAAVADSTPPQPSVQDAQVN
jgi:histidyl-tRNA synthetase